MHFLAISIQEDNKHLDNVEDELPQLQLATKGNFLFNTHNHEKLI